jgi:hypothetical protein
MKRYPIVDRRIGCHNGRFGRHAKARNRGYAHAAVRLVDEVMPMLWEALPDLGVEKTDLPLGEAVTIEVTPEEAGTFRFACGMDMVRGTILVKE